MTESYGYGDNLINIMGDPEEMEESYYVCKKQV